jgi:hypothetical protein
MRFFPGFGKAWETGLAKGLKKAGCGNKPAREDL